MNSVTLTGHTSTCITFRLPIERINRLRQESEVRNITLNTFINQIISDHLHWHRMAAPAKLYYLPKSFLIRVLNTIEDQDLTKLARDTAKNDLVDICLFLRSNYAMATLSEITEAWLRISQMPHRIQPPRSTCTIIIEHEMGFKFSYLIKEITRYLLEVAFEAQFTCDITDNTVVIKIDNNKNHLLVSN